MARMHNFLRHRSATKRTSNDNSFQPGKNFVSALRRRSPQAACDGAVKSPRRRRLPPEFTSTVGETHRHPHAVSPSLLPFSPSTLMWTRTWREDNQSRTSPANASPSNQQDRHRNPVLVNTFQTSKLNLKAGSRDVGSSPGAAGLQDCIATGGMRRSGPSL